MRVNPDYVSNLVGSLNQVGVTEQTLTEEISTGVTVNSLSDNPAAAGENVLLTTQLNADDTFSQTASSVVSLLQVGDSALGNVITQLTSAISLATVTYNGDDDVSYVETPTGQQIQTNVPGDQIFTASGANVLGTLNNLIADFSSAAPSAASVADLTNLNTALNYVSQQRVVLDDSITRLTAAGNYNTSESTQLQSAQDGLLETNTAQVASQLSSAESQQAALTQVIAAIDQEGTLFNQLQ